MKVALPNSFCQIWDKHALREPYMICTLRSTAAGTHLDFIPDLQKDRQGLLYFKKFGVPGIEPGLQPPQGRGLPLSYTPASFALEITCIWQEF